MSRIKLFFDFLDRAINGRLKVAVKNGLKCGKGVTVMRNCDFGSEPYLITLGDNVRISNDVMFVTHDGGSWAFRRGENEYKNVVRFGRIAVGNDTFLGARSIIMPNVHIGKNCVIAAGAIVTKDIPDDSVAAGVPARVVCTTGEYAEKMKNRMPKDWDFSEFEKDKRKYLEKILPE